MRSFFYTVTAKRANRRSKAMPLAGIAMSVLATLACSSTALSQRISPDTTYREMSKEQALPAFARALRNFLIDPASVTNFSMCDPPLRVKIKDGKPVRWEYIFILNSKNSSGGYTGPTSASATFEPPKPLQLIQHWPPDQKLLARCTHVPEPEIHRLIDAGS